VFSCFRGSSNVYRGVERGLGSEIGVSFSTFNHGESDRGQYVSVGASFLHGTNVADNWTAQGTAGAYWRVVRTAQGGLSVGVSGTALHYDRNLNFFSIGHGGYFSPQRYLLGSVPVSWYERRDRLEYEVAGRRSKHPAGWCADQSDTQRFARVSVRSRHAQRSELQSGKAAGPSTSSDRFTGEKGVD